MVKKTSTADPEFTKKFREEIKKEIEELKAEILKIFPDAKINYHTQTYRGSYFKKIPDDMKIENKPNSGIASVTLRVPKRIPASVVRDKLGEIGYSGFGQCEDSKEAAKGFYIYVDYIEEVNGKRNSFKRVIVG